LKAERKGERWQRMVEMLYIRLIDGFVFIWIKLFYPKRKFYFISSNSQRRMNDGIKTKALDV